MTDVAAAVGRLIDGDKATLARALTAVENAQPLASALLSALRPHTGRAHVIGVTGAPGVGKSTLCNALIREWRARGKRVGVIAVDPTSPLSGGALLGDRVRMHEHDEDEGVFVRSLAARANGSGLAAGARGAVAVLDAAGMDCVLIETVGTGQSQVDVAGLVHSSVVVNAPGLGDEVQALKAGILEIADVLVVNKADLPQAEQTARQLLAMLELRAQRAWQPPVISTSAHKGAGLVELADALQDHRQSLAGNASVRASDSTGDALRALAADDAFARHLAIEYVAGGSGNATVRMQVQDSHINFHGTCHGGALFSLADTAFGIASNSHGAQALGINAHMAYTRAARRGEVLTANAVEETRSRRFATYRVVVTRADGAIVATFTGTVTIAEPARGE